MNTEQNSPNRATVLVVHTGPRGTLVAQEFKHSCARWVQDQYMRFLEFGDAPYGRRIDEWEISQIRLADLILVVGTLDLVEKKGFQRILGEIETRRANGAVVLGVDVEPAADLPTQLPNVEFVQDPTSRLLSEFDFDGPSVGPRYICHGHRVASERSRLATRLRMIQDRTVASAAVSADSNELFPAGRAVPGYITPGLQHMLLDQMTIQRAFEVWEAVPLPLPANREPLCLYVVYDGALEETQFERLQSFVAVLFNAPSGGGNLNSPRGGVNRVMSSLLPFHGTLGGVYFVCEPPSAQTVRAAIRGARKVSSALNLKHALHEFYPFVDYLHAANFNFGGFSLDTLRYDRGGSLQVSAIDLVMKEIYGLPPLEGDPYAAPEIRRGEESTPRSDWWSLQMIEKVAKFSAMLPWGSDLAILNDYFSTKEGDPNG